MSDAEWKVVKDARTRTERMVGVEAEALLLNGKDEAIIPPAAWDRDGFPLLLEIRGDPGKNVAETYANFMKKKLEIESKPAKSNRVVFSTIHRVRLKIYKEAMKQVQEDKWADMGKVKNIHGVNVEDYSDQIVKAGKIQGINASCGLHLHFSCGKVAEMKVEEPQYESMTLPLESIPFSPGMVEGEVKGLAPFMKNLMKTSITLYRFKDWHEKKILRAQVNQLNRPAIEWMIRQLDEHLFKKFAPPKDQRTKFRQAGFYELKPYGFEYRSLPANDETIAALPEIITFAHELLADVTREESKLK